MPPESLAVTAAAVTAWAVTTLVLTPGWVARGITAVIPPWLAAAAATTAAGLAAAAAHAPATITLAVSTLAAMAAVSAVTDLACGRIPREIAWVSGAVGVAAMTLHGGGWPSLLTTAAALAVVALPALATWALTPRGLGMGDVRLLVAAALLTGWWLDPLWLVAAFTVAVMIQLVIRRRLPRIGTDADASSGDPATGTPATGAPTTSTPRRTAPFAPALGGSLVLAAVTALAVAAHL